MPVLCDFTVIQFGEVPIGSGASVSVESRSFRASFNTGGRHSQGGALLMFSVKGLTRTTANPQITINGQVIGEIHRSTPSRTPQFPENSNHWYTLNNCLRCQHP
jgi:hypothetical protein